ncbi:MAG TPA: diguanylate cyclase [Syntrophomonas sp.]|nr:diguanylate cyclase [Syntrophomonas sp.]HPT68557.1 diguanylate cyclase [Syntrophomonas sp.]
MLNWFSVALFAIGISYVFLLFYTLFKHKTRVLNTFSLVCLTIAIYVIGYGFELRSDTLEEIKFFLKIEYFGMPFMFTFWLLFVYEFYYNKAPSLKVGILLFIVPVLTLFFNVSNDYHHLLYANVETVQYDGFITAHITKGPWYFVHMIYSYAALIIGIIYFFKAWYNSFNVKRIQSMLIIGGTVIPAFIETFYLIGLAPFGLDLLPFAIGILAVCYYIAFFRYDFIEWPEMIQNAKFSESSEGIIILDSKNRLIDFNKAAQKVYSFLNLKIVGKDLVHFSQAKDLIDHKEVLFEIAVPENGLKYYEIHFTELKGKNSVLGSVYFMKDITQQKEMIQQLENLASYDSLTQIYNRRRFMEEAEKEVYRAARYDGSFALLMIDIDCFKEINDIYGHMAGDEVLKSIASGCRDRIRRTDIIGRFGGDEFSIILSGVDNDNASIIAEQIRENIENKEISYLDQILKATVSIGVATAATNNGKELDLNQIIKQADQALYNAKSHGRNCISI